MFNLKAENKKFVKKKYDSIILGSNIYSLILGFLMASQGAQLLVVEKNDFICGQNSIFSVNKGNKKYFFERYFTGFFMDEPKTSFVLYKNLKLKKEDFVFPKIKFIFYINKYAYEIHNDTQSQMNKFTYDYPQEKKYILHLTEILNKIQNDEFYLDEITRQYKTSTDLINKLFNKSSHLKNIIHTLTWFLSHNKKSFRTEDLLSILLNIFVYKFGYPKKGLNDILKKCLTTIYDNDGDILINSEVTDALVINNKITSIRIHDKERDRSTKINCKKYLLGLNSNYFYSDIVRKHDAQWQTWLKNNIEKESDFIFFIYHFVINKTLIKKFHNKAYLFFGNIKNINKSFLAINYSTFEHPNKSILKTMNIHYRILNNEYYELQKNPKKLKHFICETIIDNIYEEFKKNGINFQHNSELISITNPEKNQAEFNTPLYLKPKKEFFTKKKTEDTETNIHMVKEHFTAPSEDNSEVPTNNKIFKNCLILTGNPAYMFNNHDIFKVAVESFNLFDIDKEGDNFTHIDKMHLDDFILLLPKFYKFNKKYKNKVIGIQIDLKYCYLLKLQEDLIIRKANIKEDFLADFKFSTNFGTFKSFIQQREFLSWQVIKGKVKIKGGVWYLKRVLKKTNLWPITDEKIKELKNKDKNK